MSSYLVAIVFYYAGQISWITSAASSVLAKGQRTDFNYFLPKSPIVEPEHNGDICGLDKRGKNAKRWIGNEFFSNL